MVTILADGTDPTGTVITTLTAPATITANAVNTFTAPANTVLAANTTYWLRVAPRAFDNGISQTTSNSETGATGWSIANEAKVRVTQWETTNSKIFFTITGVANGPPTAPTGVSATAGNGQVTLSWADPSYSVISKYQYRRGSGSPLTWGSWTDFTSSATTTSVVVGSLTNGTEYSFQVRAVAGSLNGTASATVTATPTDAPSLSISGGAAVTEGAAASFTVIANAVPTSSLTVLRNVEDVTGSDFLADGQEGDNNTWLFPAGQTSATFTIATVGDSVAEQSGNIRVTLRPRSGYTVGSPGSATVRVNDDDSTQPVNNYPGVDAGATAGWQVRFGRTVAQQVVTAVQDRFTTTPPQRA